jgi:hypothetical protein
MKKIIGFFIIASISLWMWSCEDDKKDEKNKNNIEQKEIPHIDFCDCIEPSQENIKNCEFLYPIPITEDDSLQRSADIAICTGEEVSMLDTLTKVELDSAMTAYENDMTLEIKEIAEEKIDPISEDCKSFLEEYAGSIKSFSGLLNKIEKNPDDINLMIARTSEEEELYSFASKPQMFKCSQNEAFKKQVEILNNKRDKLLSN